MVYIHYKMCLEMETGGQKQMKEKPYMNRELSWLKFNERVLEEAEDERNPLCERLTFASIFQTNLDEFFMVRVGSLVDQMIVKPKEKENKTNMTSEQQIDAIIDRTVVLSSRKDIAYHNLMGELKQYGIKIINFSMLSKDESVYLEHYFDVEIAPLISPMLLGKGSPFPFLKNKEIYAAVLLEGKNGKEKVGIIPCTNNVFKRLIKLPGKEGSYMLSEELILHFVSKVYRKYNVKSKTLFRVTRNADIDADSSYDEDMDYRDAMAELIKKRKKLSPLRLELSRDVDNAILHTLVKNLKIESKYVFHVTAPLDLSFVFQIQDDLRKKPELFYDKRVPQKTPMFDMRRSIIDQIVEEDKMLSFPFESMRPFINMLHEAANDPDVLSIKMTLYRVARSSKVVEALVEAAENGKEVIVLVELRARFDEENNIEWSRRLEAAGCRVIYGIEGFKVHSKLCLITRKMGDEIQYITEIGTGNYNEKTAELYTDLMVFTKNVDIGNEASQVFNALALGEFVEDMDKLLVAPRCLQNKVIDMIEEQIELANSGKDGYVGLKLNSLTDKKIIDKLIEASCAGVKVDMVVRGICCLVPGIKGFTQNIKVISIVGRYLEHSRIYIFGKGASAKVYIASADFMTRNTVRRVEIAIPLLDKKVKDRITGMFKVMLTDNVKARIQMSDGTYIHVESKGKEINSQEYFFEEAYKNA